MKQLCTLLLVLACSLFSKAQQPETLETTFSRVERLLNKTTKQRYMDYLGVTRIVLSFKVSESGVVLTEKKQDATGAAAKPMELKYTNIPWKDMEMHRVIGSNKVRKFTIWFKKNLNSSYGDNEPIAIGTMDLVVMQDDAPELEKLIDAIHGFYKSK
ncbi:hypothetical protein [Hufsiella ginkgonis]|uniref:DUF4252 domain-containing protein n=1 Tax=Hufsiella ginkgonis TaxID=2695274 RepID=A0A7K1XTN0_9SPHI|nr:hypothetical protein [Hufsiella ginkgonis]MXV14300.1 hypothetical protein [Hufsiella ginkgonis]